CSSSRPCPRLGPNLDVQPSTVTQRQWIASTRNPGAPARGLHESLSHQKTNINQVSGENYRHPLEQITKVVAGLQPENERTESTSTQIKKAVGDLTDNFHPKPRQGWS
ncbi:hypothetical protein, partial [Vibrio owensii]|uniref:hypothetical protein n=1 Tax=Vibrio owensii TaxID=696485 RepID=UPI00406779E1